MAYFANGSEGDWYEQAICERCANYDDSQGYGNMCPVWEVHLLYNYAKEGSETEIVLNMLIPREGITNKLCNMWRPRSPEFEDLPQQYEDYLAGRTKKEQGS